MRDDGAGARDRRRSTLGAMNARNVSMSFRCKEKRNGFYIRVYVYDGNGAGRVVYEDGPFRSAKAAKASVTPTKFKKLLAFW